MSDQVYIGGRHIEGDVADDTIHGGGEDSAIDPRRPNSELELESPGSASPLQ